MNLESQVSAHEKAISSLMDATWQGDMADQTEALRHRVTKLEDQVDLLIKEIQELLNEVSASNKEAKE